MHMTQGGTVYIWSVIFKNILICILLHYEKTNFVY